jgi:enhancer of yellow 2 transcription factor
MSSRVKNDAKEEEASAAAREVSLEAKIRHEVRGRRAAPAARTVPLRQHPRRHCPRSPHLGLLACAKLIRSGERERLKRLLRDKLTECGWRDDVKQRCRGAPGPRTLGNRAD